jgi:crotonobetainyl-CoA:carnitine CoA-transferase CaiB-like acyl-CoA transferase
MIARADVFIQNFAPGAASRAGFDPAELHRKHKRLIVCSISGYGESGPYRDMKAYDLLIQAETGLVSLTGPPEAPGRVGVSVSDIAAGLNAHAAILEALYARERSGRGALIEVSLFGATAEWMAVPLIHFNAGNAPQREGLRHPSIAPYGAFEAIDGKEIVICIQNEREWARFCAGILGNPSLARDPRFSDNPSRVANRAALDGLVADVFRRETREQLGRRLKAAEIAYGHLNSVADFARHPALSLLATKVPGGTVSLPAPPGRDAATLVGHAVPEIDQHGASIRREFAA